MRLCYASADFGIQPFGNKGASLHIQQMIKAFAALGHAMTLVSPHGGAVPPQFPARVARARTVPPTITEDDTDRAQFNDRIYKERRNLAIGDSIEAEILKQHAEHPFDAIYERYSLWSAAAVRAGRKTGLPVIVEVNAPLLLEQKTYRKLVLEDQARKIEQDVFASADLVVAVSDEVADYVRSQAGRAAKVVTIPNGVDLDVFRPDGPNAGTGLAAGLPVIGFAGSLKPWHGIEDLMAAHQMLRSEKIDCALLFVGDGPMAGWIDGYARGAGIERLVRQTGWVSHHEIPDHIRAMDIAVAPYPKLDHFYFSPLKLFEYLACGRPVVASSVGQIKDVIDHGVNGMLYEPGNIRALADALKALLVNSEHRANLAAHATSAVAGRSWHDAASHILNHLHDWRERLRRRAS